MTYNFLINHLFKAIKRESIAIFDIENPFKLTSLLQKHIETHANIPKVQKSGVYYKIHYVIDCIHWLMLTEATLSITLDSELTALQLKATGEFLFSLALM